MQKLLISIIIYYQKYLSFDKGALVIFAPGGACRYEITCSEYMKQTIKEKGVGTGLVLGLKRILSCNPWN